MARQRRGNRERSVEKERDEKKKKEHRPFSELYSWSLALSGSSLITPGCSLKLSGNGLCYTKKGIITLFSSSFSDKHTPRVGARGHMRAHTHTHTCAHKHTHTLFQSVVFAIHTLSEPSFVWLRVAECGARSLAACQGTRQLSPQTHPVLEGKRRWGRRPCFWGNLEFATFSWVTIHSRSNSRLAYVMFFFSLSLSFFFCLTLFFSPCTSYHSNFEKLELLKALVNVCVFTVCLYLLTQVCVWVCVLCIKECMVTVWSFLSNVGKVVLPKDLYCFFFPQANLRNVCTRKKHNNKKRKTTFFIIFMLLIVQWLAFSLFKYEAQISFRTFVLI